MSSQAAGEYRSSTLGRGLNEVGFIHCSHRHQVERVANAAYRSAGALVLLAIETEQLAVEVREEAADSSETFPHIYGPVPTPSVVEVTPLEPAGGGLFVPETSWLSPKIEVRPSPIHGLGLFAVQPIDKGEPAAVMGGRVMRDEDFRHFIAGLERWSAAAIDEGVNVVQDPADPVAKGNHSCDPNLWLTDEIGLAALRRIEVGEEVTVDYAIMTADESWWMACSCGQSTCRGVVTGADWRSKDLQLRYARHFSPFIDRRLG